MTETGPSSSLRRIAASIRTRLIVAVSLVLLAALLGSALATRQLLLARVDERIDRELRQEVEELRRLAGGTDPATGEAFAGDAARIFEVFLSRTIPSTGEVMITFVDGALHLRTAQRTPYRLDRDPAATALWADVDEPTRGRTDTPAGPVEYLAVPLLRDGGAAGVFVVAVFRDLIADEVEQTVQTAMLAALLSLLLGVVVAAALASRILGPLERATRTARGITDADLSRRLEVEGHDEVAELAASFNGTLDRLEAAFVEQRRFVDDAGHELRTPITVIRGHLELLELVDPRDREETVTLVLDELDRMHRIVEDLLLLAKGQHQALVQPAPCDLADLLAGVHRKARVLSDDHEVVLGRADEAVVVADAQRLTQALLQLVQNAVQYTPPGSTIELAAVADDDTVSLRVSDDGPGIPEADRDRVFERFARGSDGPRRSEGAGLGLAIVAAIAVAHGGTIALGTPVSGGATFTLTIPRLSSVADDLTSRSSSVADDLTSRSSSVADDLTSRKGPRATHPDR